MKIVYFYPSMHSAGGIERVLTVKLNYLADVLKYDIVLVNYRQRKRENFFALSQNIKQIDLELEDPIFIDKKTLSASELKKINLNFNRNLKEKIEKILFEEKANFSVSAASGKEFDFLYKIKDSSIKIVEFHFTYLVSNLYILKKNSTLLSIQGWKNYYYYKKELKKYKGYKNFIVLTEKDKNFWEKDINNVIAINNPITIFTEKKSKLVNIVEIPYSLIESEYKAFTEGKIDENTAKENALNAKKIPLTTTKDNKVKIPIINIFFNTFKLLIIFSL
jgi:hypothetical protein